jgi:hypothetical protein
MRGLSRTRLAEQMRSERARYSTNRRPLQSGGILTVEDGRHMVRQSDDDERAKAERLLKRLEEKDSEMCKKWVDAAVKIVCVWRKEGKLKPLYIVDALGKGRVGTWLNSLSWFFYCWIRIMVGLGSVVRLV